MLSKTANLIPGLSTRKSAIGLACLVLALVILILTQDFIRAQLNNTGYYFSESILFSTYWWLFAPILIGQYLFFKVTRGKRSVGRTALLITPPLFHLLFFPFVVWIISKLFFYHTFSFQQTLRYTVSEHLYQLIFFYSLAFTGFHYYFRTTIKEEAHTLPLNDIPESFINMILVSEGNNKIRVSVTDICYFTANAPYINVHLTDKKYLLNESLKSISLKLDPQLFVRVHKSAIINLEKVSSYHSRLNGDYDIKMNNGVSLRVSRNYAIDFKQKFNTTHRLT